MASALPALLLSVAATAVADGTALTDALRQRDPAIAGLIDANPGMAAGWQEPFWRDALLDAPLIPGTRWRVHDLARPQPPVVAPRACQPSSGRRLGPQDWQGAQLPLWTFANGEMIPSGQSANRIETKASVADVEVSLEFMMPAPPAGVFQQRGNSGLFFQQRYEVQILDSHDNPTYPDGQMGALYGQAPPLANASRPPGQWQCLRVRFRAARFRKDGGLRSPPRATVTLNGVVLQRQQAFLGPTAFARIGAWEPHATRLPLVLQDHGDAGGRIRFRNIRVRQLGER